MKKRLTTFSFAAAHRDRVVGCLVVALAFCSVFPAPHAALAQEPEVQWRHDYNAARKEADEKHRPLLLDFGTQNCFWCKRLDLTTFRDPAVAAAINEKFIPLKVDAERETQLANALNIQSYPTIVLASPDGKVLATVVGYKEAPEFQSVLQRALSNLSTAPVVKAPPPAEPTAPEWMAHDFQEAAGALAHSEYAKALSLLKAIVEDGKDRPVQAKARQMLQDLEQQAAGRLARLKQMQDNGQASEAMVALTELLRLYPGTQAAVDAAQLLSAQAAKPDTRSGPRARRARELLAQAREDYRTQQYLCCLDRCELLAASYADLPEGSEALQLSTEIKNNPEWMRQACDGLSERLGSLYLSLAETWLQKGQAQQAILCLERVLQTLPGTRQAEAAQVRLAYIRGQTTVQTEYKKP